jgi:transcriptional regulator NrdR family protein
VVVKKSGRVEKFSRVKLFAGIYGAASGSRMPQMEKYIDIITEHVERELLALRKKKLSSLEIGEVVLDVLRREHISTFLRFLSRFKNIITEQQLRSEMKKYLGS